MCKKPLTVNKGLTILLEIHHFDVSGVVGTPEPLAHNTPEDILPNFQPKQD